MQLGFEELQGLSAPHYEQICSQDEIDKQSSDMGAQKQSHPRTVRFGCVKCNRLINFPKCRISFSLLLTNPDEPSWSLLETGQAKIKHLEQAS